MNNESLVLFLGGGNSTDAEVAFREVINILKNDVPCEVYDMPGHGNWLKSFSGEFDQDLLHIQTWAQHVFDMIANMKYTNVFIVGVSLAGHIVYRIMDLYTKNRIGPRIFPIVQGSPPSSLNPEYIKTPQYIPKSDLTKRSMAYLAKDKFSYEVASEFVRCQFPLDYEKDHPDIIEEFIQNAMCAKYLENFVGSLFGEMYDELKVIENYPFPILMMQ
jgi:hypothetical protein